MERISIHFKWNRDEAWEAISDDFDSTQEVLDDLLQDNKDAITPRFLREMYYKMRDENDRKSTQILREFLKEDNNEDGKLMPRYAHYIENMLHATDIRVLERNIVNENTHHDMMVVDNRQEMFIVHVTLNNLGFPHKHLRANLEEFNDVLPDTLWEGAPGSTAVYYNGATIEFSIF